jgi:hypothetical protein
MTYIVYAEWYGSKKKIRVTAESASKARKVVADNLIFHKIVKEEEPLDDAVEMLKSMFGMT